MENIKISSIGIYHPQNKVTNDFFIKEFDKKGKDIRRLLEAYGRNERYISDTDESNVDMAIKASLNALEKANLKGEDIDIILFSSLIPQYTMPPQSIIIHNAIKGKEECMVMDTNVNCAGMIVATDNAVKMLKGNKNFKRALIVGGDVISKHCSKDDELTYPQFGDLACAVILEKTEEDSDFLGAHYFTGSDEWDMVKYPACGNTNTYSCTDEEKRIKWKQFDGSFSVAKGKISLEKLLKEANLEISDISTFCISQYAYGMKTGFMEVFGVSGDKIPYVGDRFGYTGTSSPFLALHEAINEGKVKRGDYVAMWTIGTFWSTGALLLKY